MTRKEALQDLLAKVEAGEWDDEDDETADAIASGCVKNSFAPALGDLAWFGWHAYLGCLNAAEALHDAMLPGWRVSLAQDLVIIGGDEAFLAAVSPMDATRREHVFRPAARHANPARAWLCAILKALIAEAEA